MGKLRLRFWIEAAAAAVCGFLIILTLVVKDWIEVVFGAEPDGGDGSAEWLLVAVLALGLLISAVLARSEWHRAAGAQA